MHVYIELTLMVHAFQPLEHCPDEEPAESMGDINALHKGLIGCQHVMIKCNAHLRR